VPSVIPITVFERAWVLNALAAAGIRAAVPAELVAGLVASLGIRGTPGGAGLPPDADTTSAVLFCLGQRGMPADVDCLLAYQTGTHFCTWPGERTPSTTANAHVLEAFGSQTDPGSRYLPIIRKLSGWLSDQQRPDGSWIDKWHASPYYATTCCALALHRFGPDRSAPALAKAIEWVLSTQHTDGSWGRWGGTAEETAYAIQLLLLAGPAPDGPVTDSRVAAAAARGHRFLRLTVHQPQHPALWHDKDLYLPAAVVRAATLSAMQLAQDSGMGSR
jgi:hypothetical protein